MVANPIKRRKMALTSIFAIAFEDLRDGLKRWRVWIALAKEDISDQHRRTTLGPIWLLLNYLALAGTFIVIFGGRTDIEYFNSYIAIGLLIWLYMSETITLSVSLFIREENLIKGTTLPLSVYILRLTTQSIIRAGYMLLGCLTLLYCVGAPLSTGWLWALLSLSLILLITPAAIASFAVAGAFFPDLQFVVQNLMRLGMFLTPIFWTAGNSEGARRVLADWNPFAFFLEIVRVPILTGNPPSQAIFVCLAIGFSLWLCALLLIGRFRKQIVFVL